MVVVVVVAVVVVELARADGRFSIPEHKYRHAHLKGQELGCMNEIGTWAHCHGELATSYRSFLSLCSDHFCSWWLNRESSHCCNGNIDFYDRDNTNQE